ncbi:MAG: GIY-YIG nuclease family protein [Symploca sp. SIO1B1]|nr:GIY-YIG nuclease family protein [Symploca sp. SIO1B1]
MASPNNNKRPGWVYVLEEIDPISGSPTGFYKVGRTEQERVEDRVRNYQTGNPRRLEVFYREVVPEPDEAEKSLHEDLKKYRVDFGGGEEWFRLPQTKLSRFRPNTTPSNSRHLPKWLKYLLAGIGVLVIFI